jgi:hypothetical protein
MDCGAFYCAACIEKRAFDYSNFAFDSISAVCTGDRVESLTLGTLLALGIIVITVIVRNSDA